MGTNSKLKGTVSAAYSRSNKPGCATLVDISGLFKENVDGRGVDSPPMQLRLRNVPILNSPYRTPTNKGGAGKGETAAINNNGDELDTDSASRPIS